MFDASSQVLIDAGRRRLHDIKEFQIPRLRKCESSLADQQQLATELREDMDNVARLAEELAVAVDDQQSEKARRELESVVDEMKNALSQLRKDTRAALLLSKKAIDARNAKAIREELFISSAAKEKQSLSEKVTEDALMKANEDVTEALRRTIDRMQGELERSVLASQMLDASTANLRSTSQTHDTLNTLMSTSKHLITALEKSDWLDRVLILSAFTFFVLVVLFILKQRFIDRGLRIALWWTKYIPLPSFGGSSSSSSRMDKLRVAEEGSLSLISTTVVPIASSLSSAVMSSSNMMLVSESASSELFGATSTAPHATPTEASISISSTLEEETPLASSAVVDIPPPVHVEF